MNQPRTQRLAQATLLVAGVLATQVQAGPINTDAALAPGEGSTILRLQYVYAESDGAGQVVHRNTSSVRAAIVYGFRENLTFLLSVPYHHQQSDTFQPKLGRTNDTRDGIGDVTIAVKYRFWKHDPEPTMTLRWAGLLGLNVRSGDSDFTSDSYDPILGAVFSWRKHRNRFDADLIYQINTGGGSRGHDVLRYDLAYSFRVAPVTYDGTAPWELDAVAELNGQYVADGSHTLYVSPGLQYITEYWVFETSVQIPVSQTVDGPETEYRIVAGFRFRW